MLKVYLSNIATSEGLWLAFPMGSQERQEAMKFGGEGTNEIGAATRDRKSTRLNSSHPLSSRMPSSA